MVRANLGELSARVSLDTVDFSRNLAALKREMRLAKTDIDLAARGVHGFGSEMTSTQAQMALVERQIGLNQQAMERHSKEYDNAAQAARNGTGEISKAMQQAQRKHQEARLEVERLTEQYRELYKVDAREGSTFYQSMDRMDKVGGKLKTVGRDVTKFGRSWTRMGVVVGLAAGAVIKSATDFESAMANVQKTTDAPQHQIEQLGGEIRALSHDIPVAAAELANMAALGGQLGILPENLREFTEVVAALEVATNMTGEEAGKMLAQFANITNMDHGDFDNLASSIVKIGNNSATTEKDVAEMAMHLAGAGESAGLSQSEIIGLAGGLSSLGIAAQRGGSSFSRIMIDMATASDTGTDAMRELENATGLTMREIELMSSNSSGDFRELADSLGMTRQEVMKIVNSANDLEGFARIAGMSADEFAQAFGEDAVGAIGLFIDGLADAETHGETAIGILDDLGISEIRLRDTLLRAGNARGVLNETVQMSNEAFIENTELTREAGIYYGTTESQIKMFRNRVQDTAIELGTALLPALIELLNSADPLINMFSNLSDRFVALDDDTKELIVQLGAFAILGGPIVTVLGKFIGGFGALTQVVGRGGKALFDWALDGKVAGKTLGELTTQTGHANSTLGMFALKAKASVAALGPFAPALLAVAGAVTVGYGAWKIWGEEAYEAAQRTKRWGADVSEETDNVLNDFIEMNEDISYGTFMMSRDVEEGAHMATQAYQSMGEDIKETVLESIAEQEEAYGRMPQTVRDAMSEIHSDRLADQEAVITEVDNLNGRINEIYATAVEESRELTNQELAVIESYHNRLTELRTQTLDETAETQRQVHAIVREEIAEFSEEQLKMRDQFLKDELSMSIEYFDEQRNLSEEAYATGQIDRFQHQQELKKINEAEHDSNLFFAKEFVKIWSERGHSIEEIELMLENWGLTHSEVMQEMAFENAEAQRGMGLIIKDIGDLHSEVGQANAMWNDFALENKFGEVDTNVTEVIKQASEDEDKWNDLIFILQHAELTTNAREEIETALRENGKWNELDWYHHEANLFTNAQAIAIEYMKANGDWEGLEFLEKTAVLDTNTPEQLEQILRDFGLWDRLDPSVKEMIVTSNAEQEANNGRGAVDDWDRLRPLPLNMNATTNAPAVVRAAQRAIDSLRGKTVRVETVHSVTNAPNSGPYATRNAAGLNFHPGGLAVLGDGGNNEPYLTPDGQFGVSPKRDTLFDFPRGTKIWRNMEALMNDLPKYANGTRNQPMQVGDRIFNQISDALVPFHSAQAAQVSGGNSTVVQGDTYHINLNITGDLPNSAVKRMADTIQREIKSAEDRRKAAKGEGWTY